MKIYSHIKRCVIFVGHKKTDSEYTVAGTALLAVHENSYFRSHIVTAKHVIEGIKKKLGLDEIYLKVNNKAGKSEWIRTEFKDWILHTDPDVDVAIHRHNFNSHEWDHLFYPLTNDMILNDNTIKQFQIDVGDELFIAGLFQYHYGTEKNIPVIRVGNIAALREEKIRVSKHLIDGYLIQAQSIGGLSGSPVFVHIDSTRAMRYGNSQITDDPSFYLMGIIHGHFDEDLYGNKINTGIAIVTPIEKIVELVKTDL